METLTAVVSRDPETCWRFFTDARLLTSWVPGLRRAQVIALEHGLPSEIHFEFASSLAYTLIYRYDRGRGEVHWTPKLGKRDGVMGFVRFEPDEAGARITYGLEQGDGRGTAERALGELEPVLAAFATAVQAAR